MIHFDLPKQQSSIIKVLGVGGGGSNAVNYMYAQNIEGVDFVICNTDAKALEQSRIPNKIQLGPHLTQGLGAGANPEIGKQATEESLEEIKRILEVNTKMAFICAGMGGGTGTGGAPIVAKICRDLGILTVGIVTTPFGFEGPRRHQQAEEGIRALEPHVDTLLVISNDKLRMQYGNLKMKDAFGKADNVLATAAKCITDIINSKGHIIVDFADVCTVMKNGGVAILGSASVDGEERAQNAIEEALSSPLLNDNEIRGAKWILININSAEGDHECTMDEMEIINSHLRMQAGEETDVIMGMGIDNTLDNKIGITLIATGFKHKDPFDKKVEKQPEVKEEKVVMPLNLGVTEEKVALAQPQVAPQQSLFVEEIVEEAKPEVIKAVGAPEVMPEPVAKVATDGSLHFELSLESAPVVKQETTDKVVNTPAGEMTYFEKNTIEQQSSASAGFLNKPSNIYVQQPIASAPVSQQPVAVEFESVVERVAEVEVKKEDLSLVIKQEEVSRSSVGKVISEFDIDELEIDQKRKAAERIQKLRSLTFSSSDPNNEFDTVPAYVRRNMELFGNTLTSAEDFYSKYTVKTDENNETQISSINTFLDGKKPD